MTERRMNSNHEDSGPTDIESNKPVLCPFTVLIDTREQSPYAFQHFKADACYKTNSGVSRDLYIPKTVSTIRTGDYSIPGYESEVCIERKSLTDLYGTLGGGRERFERELERMSKIRVAHVVIEASWIAILQSPPERSKLNPKSVFRSINAWEQEFPTIHWQFMDARTLAEHKTFRILERFWNKKQESLRVNSDSTAKPNGKPITQKSDRLT